MKLTTKLIITFIIIIALMLAGAYYYFYSMGNVKTNTNLTKIENSNKIYTYNIYSDFYFRVTKYDSIGNVQAEYTELQPLKTSIGFDLSKKSHTPIIKTIKGDKLVLGEKDADYVRKFRVMLQKFEKDFGAIVATQDDYIIKNSIESAKKIVKNLYGIDLEEQNIKQNYYEEIKNLPIENMRIKYFKLTEIPKNEKKPLEVASKWQPNIIEWNFGENDKIYMQYLMKWKNSDLDDFITKNYKNKVVAKLVKVNNNQLKKMYFIKINGQNRIDTLFMDANGYIYVLTFEASNPKSFEKYISDYLKIAYGVHFVDVKGFDNWWAREQLKNSNFSNVYVWFVSKVNYSNDTVDDPLGFDCSSENEIILNIGNYKYEHDKNEWVCVTNPLYNVRHTLIWKKTDNIFEVGKKYKISVIEEDIIRNDYFSGQSIIFTQDDINKVNNGEVLKKHIGANYYIYFSKN